MLLEADSGAVHLGAWALVMGATRNPSKTYANGVRAGQCSSGNRARHVRPAVPSGGCRSTPMLLEADSGAVHSGNV